MFVRRQRQREFRPERTGITYVYLHDFSNERSKGAAGSPAATAPGEFQHRFGRRPRRRVGICRVAMASSAWRKLCSSSLVEMLVGVSEASSRRATAVATHSKSVAMSLMVRPGAGRLRWSAREELRPRPERGGWGGPLVGSTTAVAAAAPTPSQQQLFLPQPFLPPGSAAERQKRLCYSGAPLNEVLKAPPMFSDAGAVRSQAPS